MTQDQAIALCLKIGLICGFLSLVIWVAVYTVLTGGRWVKNPLGRTIVAEAVLIAALLVPVSLPLFFSLSTVDGRLARWADVVLIALATPVMVWRCLVWVRIGRLPRDGHDGLTPVREGPAAGAFCRFGPPRRP